MTDGLIGSAAVVVGVITLIPLALGIGLVVYGCRGVSAPAAWRRRASASPA